MSLNDNTMFTNNVTSLISRLGDVGRGAYSLRRPGCAVTSMVRKQKIKQIAAFSSEISFDRRSLKSPHESMHILYIFRN